MADYFLSYNSADQAKAEWVAWTLRDAGYAVRFAKWELGAGHDIAQWMTDALEDCEAMVCVASPDYLKPQAKFSALERAAMLWQDIEGKAARLIFVKIRPCTLPKIFGTRSYISLSGKSRDEAKALLLEAIKPPSAPSSEPVFEVATAAEPPRQAAPPSAISPVPPMPAASSSQTTNIAIHVPTHFLGRDAEIDAIERALRRSDGRVAVAALHGPRGAGKTTAAVAFAERRRDRYPVAWWVRAQTPEGMRADLVALGVRLGWVADDAQEAAALPQILERLAADGAGILLIFDNVMSADDVRPYLPRRGEADVLITTTFHAWRGIAEPVEIALWPKETGAAFLMARSGESGDLNAAERLSEALGGLPLAHEQAAAYCERLSVSLADYLTRLEAQPAKLLDDARHAPAAYHDGLTVAKTYGLAISEASKLHPAAGPLLRHAAFLSADPIPLFLFREGRDALDEPLKGLLADDGLDEALAALAAFALVDRETITDERDVSLTTASFRLHRLIRQVARLDVDVEPLLNALVRAVGEAAHHTSNYDDSTVWPRWRRLDAHALALAERAVGVDAAQTDALAGLLDLLASYRHGALADLAAARVFFERSLAVAEATLGPDHEITAKSLNNLASVVGDQGDLAAGRTLLERALSILERVKGPEHEDTAAATNNLALNLKRLGDLDAARRLYERALAIDEKTVGPGHIRTAIDLNNLGTLLHSQGELAAARPHLERALAIKERVRGPRHTDTGLGLNNLAQLLVRLGERDAARPLFERAVSIYREGFGETHPGTTSIRENAAAFALLDGRAADALALAETALAAREAAAAPSAGIGRAARIAADALAALGRTDDASALRAKHGITP